MIRLALGLVLVFAAAGCERDAPPGKSGGAPLPTRDGGGGPQGAASAAPPAHKVDGGAARGGGAADAGSEAQGRDRPGGRRRVVEEPRTIDAILFELEEIECTGIDFDDPAADYERRFQRPEDLQEEARALGPQALEVLLERLARSPKEDGVGTLRRRPFLCEVVGALAARRPEVVGAALLQLRPRDVQQIIAALPREEAASVIGTWFRGQQDEARKAKVQGTPKLRVMLLSAYADLSRPTRDDPVLALARKDPSPAVQKCAEDLAR